MALLSVYTALPKGRASTTLCKCMQQRGQGDSDPIDWPRADATLSFEVSVVLYRSGLRGEHAFEDCDVQVYNAGEGRLHGAAIRRPGRSAQWSGTLLVVSASDQLDGGVLVIDDSPVPSFETYISFVPRRTPYEICTVRSGWLCVMAAAVVRG